MHRVRSLLRAPDGYVGLLAFLLYLRTLAPDVFVSDFAEFQYQPPILGLPHPNGFPLYMLMGWAWSHLPWGTWAWKMNLLSALWGGIAVALTTAFARRLSGRASVGILAGGLWALTPTFWGYSLLAERYSLNMSLLIGAVWTAWEATRRPNPRVWRILSAGLLGLGLTVHPSDALLIPFWWGYLLWRIPTLRRDVRGWGEALLAGALPQITFLYVPWRWAVYARWPLLPGIGRSSAVYKGLVHVWYEPPLRWDLVWYYITGLGGYARGLLAGGWREAIPLLRDVWPYWRAELPWPLVLLALVGLVALWRRERALTLMLFAFTLFLTLMVAYIRQGKNDAYLLPAFWVLLLLAAFSVDLLPEGGRWEGRRAFRVALYGGIGGVLLLLFLARYPHRDLSRRLDIRETWLTVLATPLEEGAGLLGHWSDLTPLWYMQQAEARRPDLWGLFPPDEERIIDPWLATGHPLYLIAPTHGWAPHLTQRYTLVPWGPAVRVLPRGQAFSCLREEEARALLHSEVLDMVRPTLPDRLTPDEPTVLAFCWRARQPVPRDVFLEVRLSPAWGGDDVVLHGPLISPWYPASRVPARGEGLGVLPLRLPWGTPPGEYTARLHFFRLVDGSAVPWPGSPDFSLGSVTVAATRTFERSRFPRATVPLLAPRAGPLRLRGWTLSRTPVRPGDPVRLDMIWEVVRPPRAGLSLQVRFWGRGDRGLLTLAMPLLPSAPPETWTPGTILRTRHVLRAPRGLGDHMYLVEPRLFEGDAFRPWFPTGRWIVGRIRVHDRPHLWTRPEGFVPLEAHFAGVGDLVGYRVEGGRELRVVLLWKATDAGEHSYKVFVHLLDAQGHLVTQHDSLPAQGTLPTDVWVPGEYIVDPHPLEGAAQGAVLRVGLYDPATGQRVPVTRSSLPVRDNSVELPIREGASRD